MQASTSQVAVGMAAYASSHCNFIIAIILAELMFLRYLPGLQGSENFSKYKCPLER